MKQQRVKEEEERDFEKLKLRVFGVPFKVGGGFSSNGNRFFFSFNTNKITTQLNF